MSSYEELAKLHHRQLLLESPEFNFTVRLLDLFEPMFTLAWARAYRTAVPEGLLANPLRAKVLDIAADNARRALAAQKEAVRAAEVATDLHIDLR